MLIPPMLIAQITDMHIVSAAEGTTRGVDPAARLARAVDAVNAFTPQPDLVLATGDLVEHGTAEEYAHLAEVMAPLKTPVYYIPGNHDERGPLRASLANHGVWPEGDYLHFTVEDFPLRIIALDTKQIDSHGGQMCPARITWLEQRLDEAPGRPTLIVMHHPPFWTGSGGFDNFGFDNLDAFRGVIAPRTNVAGILSGHVHRVASARIGQTPVHICPSTAYTYSADLIPEFSIRKTAEPPGFQMHLWREGEGLISHTYWLDPD